MTKKFGFNNRYKPVINKINTILYCQAFYHFLVDKIIELYNPLILNPPLFTYNHNSLLSNPYNQRNFYFDNKYSDDFFTIVNTPDTYLLSLSNELKEKSLYVHSYYLNRDALLTNWNSMLTEQIWLDIPAILADLNHNFLISLIKKFYSILINITNEQILKKIHLVDQNKQINDFTIINSQELENNYKRLTIDQALNFVVKKYKQVIITNPLKPTINNQIIKHGIPVSQKFDCSASLFVWDKKSKTNIELINVYARPSFIDSKKQLLNYNPTDFEQNIYDNKLFPPKQLTDFEERKQNICLNLNLSNLYLFFLNKIHLAEVVNSVWPQEFTEYVKKEKIEIF